MKNNANSIAIAFVLAATSFLTSCAKREQTYADRVREAADKTQFTAFLDAHHSAIGIRLLCADKQTIGALAQAKVKHMLPEGIYPHVIPLIQLYVDNRISRETLRTVFSDSYFELYKAKNVTKEQATRSVMDLIDQCKAHGIKIDSFDHQDSIFTSAEYPGFRNYHTDLYLMMAHTIEGNPEIMTSSEEQRRLAIGFIEQQFRKNYPARYSALLASEAQREARLAQTRARILTDIDFRKEIATDHYGSGGLTRTRYDEIMAGNINAAIADILMYGHQSKLRKEADPVFATRIREAASGERAAIIHGAAHFYRASDDVDSHLGESNVTVIEVYSSKSPAPNRASSAADRDTPDFSIDIDTGVWTTKDGTNITIKMPAGFGQAMAEPQQPR